MRERERGACLYKCKTWAIDLTMVNGMVKTETTCDARHIQTYHWQMMAFLYSLISQVSLWKKG